MVPLNDRFDQRDIYILYKVNENTIFTKSQQQPYPYMRNATVFRITIIFHAKRI